MINFEVDLRGHLMPIRDQGRRQTCLAFASSDAHAMVHNRPMSNLSVEYAHYSACKRMPQFQPANGTSDDAMFEALRIDGQPPEEDWPYLSVLPNDLANYHPPAILSGLVRHAGEPLQSLDEAEAALRSGWPVIMGITLSDSFYRLTSATVLQSDPDITGARRHAILGVGLFSNASGTGFLIRNSWGTKWADGGYGLISKSYIQPRTIFLGVYRA